MTGYVGVAAAFITFVGMDSGDAGANNATSSYRTAGA